MAKLEMAKNIYLQIQKVLPFGCPPNFCLFPKRLKMSKEIRMSNIFLWVTQDKLVVRKWPTDCSTEHGRELCPDSKFLLMAETYLSTTFDPNISYFFDLCLHWVSLSSLLSIWTNQYFAISTFARIEKDNLGLNWPKL